MFGARRLACAVVASSLAMVAGFAAGPAAATQMTITYTGTVGEGYDTYGLFGGGPGSTLTGKDFTARFVLNDLAGVSTYDPPTSSTYTYTFPGAFSPDRAWIIISGERHDMWCILSSFCSFGDAVSAGDGTPLGLSGTAWGIISGIDLNDVSGSHESLGLGIVSTTNPFITSYDYHHPFTYTAAPGDGVSSEMRIRDTDGTVLTQDVVATLLSSSVTVAIPEPQTWTLMILGFGAAGMALRRRRAPRPA